MRMASAVRFFYFQEDNKMRKNYYCPICGNESDVQTKKCPICNASMLAYSTYETISNTDASQAVQKIDSKVPYDVSKQEFSQHKFISDIYECEKQKYVIENRIKTLNKEIANASYIKQYNDTEFAKYEKKNKKRKLFERDYSKLNDAVNSFEERVGMYFVFGGIAGVIVGFITNLLHFLGILEKVDRGLIKGYVLPGLKTMLITFAIALGIMAIDYIKSSLSDLNKRKSVKRSNNKIPEKNREIEEFNQKLKEECNEKYLNYVNIRRKEINRTVPLMKQEREEAKNQLAFLNETLNSLYNLRINGVLCLHPNYQGLVPISVIYGYFDTGRCTQLQGHEGAYNLYEDEKMKGMIINKLDIVSQQLGQLNTAMVYVGRALETCNERLSFMEESSNKLIKSVNNMNSDISNQLNGVSNQMSTIEENTANSAYYAEVGAKMATFNTVYNLLKD